MLVVEPARNEDAIEITKLAARNLSEQYDPEWLVGQISKPHAFYVARDVPRNRVVGFALADLDGTEGHLLAIAVEPVHRQHGLGRALVKTVSSELAREGAYRMHLEVRADDPRAQLFYAGLGFAPEGLQEHVYVDGGDAVRMARPL